MNYQKHNVIQITLQISDEECIFPPHNSQKAAVVEDHRFPIIPPGPLLRSHHCHRYTCRATAAPRRETPFPLCSRNKLHFSSPKQKNSPRFKCTRVTGPVWQVCWFVKFICEVVYLHLQPFNIITQELCFISKVMKCMEACVRYGIKKLKAWHEKSNLP